MIFKLIFAIILTEAITEIVTKSVIFSPIREFFFNRRKNALFNWIHELLDCGYCTSVWVGWLLAILFFNEKMLIDRYIDWIFIGLFLHRLSNLLHNIFDKVYEGNEITNTNGQG